MKTLLSITALLAVSLIATQESAAKGSSGSSHGGHSGHSYSGHSYSSHHTRWSSYCWNQRYGCYFYQCPTSNCYYYFYAPSCCYLPVTCLPQYPPTAVAYQSVSPGVIPLPVQAAIQVTNTNVNTASIGGPGPVTPGFPPRMP